MIEADSVDSVLCEAADSGYLWCFLQGCGHVIGETLAPAALEQNTDGSRPEESDRRGRFSGGRQILGDEAGGFGLDEQCLLISLRHYEALGRPAFGAPGGAPVDCLLPALQETSQPIEVCCWR